MTMPRQIQAHSPPPTPGHKDEREAHRKDTVAWFPELIIQTLYNALCKNFSVIVICLICHNILSLAFPVGEKMSNICLPRLGCPEHEYDLIKKKLLRSTSALGVFLREKNSVEVEHKTLAWKKARDRLKGTGHWKIELFGEIFDVEVFGVLSILNYALSRGEVVFTE